MTDTKRMLELRLQKALASLPTVVGNEAVNFTLDRFKQQNWLGSYTKPWQRRKPGAPRNTGRAILVDTGRLKRGNRIVSTAPLKVVIGNDVPYARAHNYGFRGVVSIGSYSRKKFGLQRSGRLKKKSVAGSVQVKGHTRNMNLPQRQFMGNSPYLLSRLSRVAKAHLLKHLKS